MVRDLSWLHCYWELTRHAIARAEAALGQEWHTARPILRVLDVSSRDITNTAESIVRDIDIHGGCNNLYLDVAKPPPPFLIHIRYPSPPGQFFPPAPSHRGSPPPAGPTHPLPEK